MRLKCYLRGLGIGVVVTAIIMSLSGYGKPGTMTDAQVIARAKELGMVDGVLTELSETEETLQETTEDVQDDEGNAQDSGSREAESGEEEAESEPQEDGAESEAALTEPEEAEADGEQPEEVTQQTAQAATIVVAVYPGEGSHTVSRKLANLGLVESADIFDDFLCQNGYDKKLCAGNYEIPEGATAHEIARALTGG